MPKGSMQFHKQYVCLPVDERSTMSYTIYKIKGYF